MLAKLTSKNQLTLPKAVLDKLPAATYFEVQAEGGRIILTPVRISREDAVQPARGWRAGWDQQFRDMAERGDDQLLDAPTPTDWEADEWEW